MTFFRRSLANLGFGIFVGLTGLACGGSVSEAALPGDGYLARCENGILHCVRRAETLCKERGFTVVSGRQVNEVLGGSSSAYQKKVSEGELQFYCGQRVIPQGCEQAPQDANAVYQLGQTASPSPAASGPVTSTPLCARRHPALCGPWGL
jgi:hypothetical protein